MKMVFSNENIFLVNNVKNLIEAQAIQTFIKNEFAQGAIGEVSAFDCWPELWIFNDSDLERALEIVDKSRSGGSAVDWICNYCGELNDPSFEICWSCQGENT